MPARGISRPARSGCRRDGHTPVGSGAREIGQLMQRGPPRPEPSSEPAILTTSMPASSSRSLVLVVALVGDCDPRGQRQGVVAVVPLLALGGDRIQPGVDLVQRCRCPSPGPRRRRNGSGLGDPEHQVGVVAPGDRRLDDRDRDRPAGRGRRWGTSRPCRRRPSCTRCRGAWWPGPGRSAPPAWCGRGRRGTPVGPAARRPRAWCAHPRPRRSPRVRGAGRRRPRRARGASRGSSGCPRSEGGRCR